MTKIKFEYEKTCQIDHDQIISIAKTIIPEIKKIKNELKKNYDTDYAFANLPADLDNLGIIEELIKNKLSYDIRALVVIGIGGSNLGTIAVHEIINGKLYNAKNPKLKVYFADSTDTSYISDIYDLINKELEANSNVLFNVVSKSGTTIETIANFEVFVNLLKKFRPNNFQDFIVVTTNRDSLLWNYAKKINCSILEIPKKVGGRYSVLSSASLFPLGVLSIDNKKLLQGACDFLHNCLDENIEANLSALSASILYAQYKKNIKINDILLFGNDLESLGKWYRQLMGESIGKEFNLKKEKVNVGITPTISIGSTDLHSIGQLYLGGPTDKFLTFVHILNNKKIHIPVLNDFEKVIPNVFDIDLSKIMNAIIKGIQIAYFKKQIPFCSISLDKKSEYEIGQFLQFKMFEIVYLAYLFGVNPFDQPNVELYKKETEKLFKENQ